MIIYADVVFFLNFVSSATLLFAYGLIFGIRYRALKILAGAAISGVYAVLEIIFNLPYIIRTAVLFCICAVVFGASGTMYNTLRIMFIIICLEVVFVAIMTVAGATAYVSYGMVTVFANSIAGIIIYALSYPTVFFIRYIIRNKSRIKKACFMINGTQINVDLLYDSGNLLMHKGYSVAIVSWDAVSGAFLGMTYEDVKFNADDAVVFQTVGTGGIMPVVKPQNCTICGIKSEIYVAIADRGFGRCGGIVGDVKNKIVGEEIKCSF